MNILVYEADPIITNRKMLARQETGYGLESQNTTSQDPKCVQLESTREKEKQ